MWTATRHTPSSGLDRLSPTSQQASKGHLAGRGQRHRQRAVSPDCRQCAVSHQYVHHLAHAIRALRPGAVHLVEQFADSPWPKRLANQQAVDRLSHRSPSPRQRRQFHPYGPTDTAAANQVHLKRFRHDRTMFSRTPTMLLDIADAPIGGGLLHPGGLGVRRNGHRSGPISPLARQIPDLRRPHGQRRRARRNSPCPQQELGSRIDDGVGPHSDSVTRHVTHR